MRRMAAALILILFALAAGVEAVSGKLLTVVGNLTMSASSHFQGPAIAVGKYQHFAVLGKGLGTPLNVQFVFGTDASGRIGGPGAEAAVAAADKALSTY